MKEETKIKNRERARKWYQDNRQRKLDYERERLNKGKVLQDRIDKAIEYINHENFKRTILVGVGTKKYTRNILDNVLNILKGE